MGCRKRVQRFPEALVRFICILSVCQQGPFWDATATGALGVLFATNWDSESEMRSPKNNYPKFSCCPISREGILRGFGGCSWKYLSSKSPPQVLSDTSWLIMPYIFSVHFLSPWCRGIIKAVYFSSIGLSYGHHLYISIYNIYWYRCWYWLQRIFLVTVQGFSYG